MSEQTTSDGWVLRLGALAGIVGALIGMVGNLLHPVVPTGDPELIAGTIAESRTWIPVHLAIVLGIILMLGGLVAISRSITGGLPGALARFGRFAAVAGVTVGVILVTVDGLAAKHLADAWAAAAPEEEIAALQVVLAEETINFALAALFNILFAGVTFVLYGLAVAWSRVYPRWLGWVVVLAGVGSVAVGLVQAYAGESTAFTRILTIVFPTVITMWIVVMGALLFRRTGSLEPAVAGTFEGSLRDGGDLAASGTRHEMTIRQGWTGGRS